MSAFTPTDEILSWVQLCLPRLFFLAQMVNYIIKLSIIYLLVIVKNSQEQNFCFFEEEFLFNFMQENNLRLNM